METEVLLSIALLMVVKTNERTMKDEYNSKSNRRPNPYGSDGVMRRKSSN